jgi:phosphoglycolate phosphatase-like HAD superfamily hydrolase
MPTASPLLLLWDIDHTLIAISGVGREIYSQAFERVFGRPLVHIADMSGRTEYAITRDTLALNGVEPDHPDHPDRSAEAFYAALTQASLALADRMRDEGRTLSGAREALAALASDGNVQSVVTGNLPDIAALKLKAFELDGFLDLEIGGYGDIARDRAVLVRMAIELAEEKYDVAFRAENTVVIGDTTHDVKGALDNGALAVGVATGVSSVDDLQAAGAHVVLPDLADLAELHAFLSDRPNRVPR